MPTTLTEQDPATRIPDVRALPLGPQSNKPASAHTAIVKRILRNDGVEVPAAAFQSSI